MTVSTTSSMVTYAGDGSTTVFTFPFPGVAPTDIRVSTITGGITSIVPANQYTLVLNGPVAPNPTGVGGAVTLLTPPALGTSLVITRVAPFIQPTSLANQGILYQVVIEQSLDYLTLLTQQLDTRVSNLVQAPPIPGGPGGGIYTNVKDFGALGNGSADDTAAIQSAINAVKNNGFGGGTVFFPPGTYNCNGGITIFTGVCLLGSGQNSSYLVAAGNDVIVVTFDPGSGRASMQQLSVYGKGINNDVGTFGATKEAVLCNGVGNIIRDCTIAGGFYCLNVPGNDCYFEQVSFDVGASYGETAIHSVGANWYHRCKIDPASTGLSGNNGPAYPNWAAGTPYVQGNVVKNGAAYLMQCVTAGTSGGSPPVLRNYGLPITDNTVTWFLFAPIEYFGVSLQHPAGENTFTMCDMSSPLYAYGPVSASMAVNSSSIAAFTKVDECVLSGGLQLISSIAFTITDCEIGGTCLVQDGYFQMHGCTGPTAVSIAANVNDFNILGNWFNGGSVTVAAGTSDHYIISNNLRVTVSDGGTGIHKSVASNF